MVPYLREKEPVGGAPYIGPRLGGRPKLEVSVSQLDARQAPRYYVIDNLHNWNSSSDY